MLSFLNRLGVLLSFLSAFLRSTLTMRRTVDLISILSNLITRAATARASRISTTVTNELLTNGSVEEGILERATATLSRRMTYSITRLVGRGINTSSNIIVCGRLTNGLNEITSGRTTTRLAIIDRVGDLRRRIITTCRNLTLENYAAESDGILASTIIITRLTNYRLTLRLRILELNESTNT